MRIKILSISERQPEWVQLACADYARRLPKHLAPEWIELALARHREDIERAKNDEAVRIGAALPKSAHVVALDEHGSEWTSLELSVQLQRWQSSGKDVALLIGGPDGLGASLLARAEQRWSLSRLTLPHAMVRVLLIEQLYRASSILAAHPYHRG